jgi:acyl-CoA synthetase (AMP-forming)/AMP-acid ligase II
MSLLSIGTGKVLSILEKIAAFLQAKQVRNQCIAIALDRGIEAASCIYGVLSAGAVYLPLDNTVLSGA